MGVAESFTMTLQYLFALIVSISFYNQALADQPTIPPIKALKACAQALSTREPLLGTEIPGIDGAAIPLLCQDTPRAKLSSDFSPEELKHGNVPANHPEIFVYLTDEGLRFAEFPSFYYFVFYHDASNAIDVGVLPNHIMPITLPSGAPAFVIQEGSDAGKIIPIERLNDYASSQFFLGTAAKAKSRYLDKYQGFLKQAKLPNVTLSNESALSEQQTRDCIRNALKKKLIDTIDRSGAEQLFSTYHFDQDQMAAGQAASHHDPVTLDQIKEKYQNTQDQWIQLYAAKARSINACSGVFDEADYTEAGQHALRFFLPGYLQAKPYIDRLSI